MNRPLIIGFDPGLTSAVAALDLDGNIVSIHERKGWTVSETGAAVGRAGRPLLIATDKAKAPEAVKKMAAAFSAKVWAPDHDLSIAEKGKLVEELCKEKPQWGQHEKDAVTAAFAAYKSMATGFSKVEDTLRLLGLEERAEEVKNMLLTKRAKNTAEAIGMIMRPKQPEERVEIRTAGGQLRTDDLLRKIRSMENTTGIQKAYIERLEGKLKELEASRKQLLDERLRHSAAARKEALRDKELQLRESIVLNLREEIKVLKKEKEQLQASVNRQGELERLLAEDRIPMVPVAAWTKEALAEADRSHGIRDRIISIQNFSPSNTATRYCVALGVKGVIGALDEETTERLRTADVIVITGLEPEAGEQWRSSGREEFERAMKSSERSGFLKWLDSYKQTKGI